jgi:hypothetical protein
MDEPVALEDGTPAQVMARLPSPHCTYDSRLMHLCPHAVMEWRGGDQTCRYFNVALTDRGMEALCRSPHHIRWQMAAGARVADPINGVGHFGRPAAPQVTAADKGD